MSHVSRLSRLLFAAALVCSAWLAAAPLQPAFAQVCCPSGCVQNGGACQRAGQQTSCPTVACQRAPTPTPTPGGSGKGAPLITYPVRPSSYGVCDRPVGYMPPGSFHKTCNDIMFACDMKTDTLTATCRSGQGLRKSTLPSASTCVDVRNDNGLLKCHQRVRRVSG